MCETGYADGCRAGDGFLVETNRVANPGLTSVTLCACQDHLTEAVREQLANNALLYARGMPTPPGLRLGSREWGVTVLTITPDPS
jgi:hypothetical protein